MSIPTREALPTQRRMIVDQDSVEIVPAILRATWEGIQEDWNKVATVAGHIQIDLTDGIFAGEGTFRQIRDFKKLSKSQKIELHLMVHTPGNFVDDIIDLNPARCIFHLESFSGTNDLNFIYTKLREQTQAQLALALNPDSPNNWLEEHLELLDYVMFMGYSPGWANQPIQTIVFKKITDFAAKYPAFPIAVDGHVSKETAPDYVQAGARILCANTSVFGEGHPAENIEQLRLLAEQYLK